VALDLGAAGLVVGPQGDPGPTGPAGGSGMATTAINGTGPAVTGVFSFLGPIATVTFTLLGGQRVMAAASAETSGDASGDIWLDICYQHPGDTGPPTELSGGNYTLTTVETAPSAISTIESGVLALGTYEVGLCALAGQVTLTYGRVVGWVQVLN
jgi:hypothetical protein